MSLLQLKNANVTIEDSNGYNEILKDISLDFKSKKIYVITGPNGGGKSTLAKYIMGIMPNSGGNLFLNNKNISDLDIVNRSKKGIGYAFQTPAKFKGLTVSELLNYAKGESNKSKSDVLRSVGLCPEEYLGRTIDATFSGGELKRIELASVLIRDLKVAIFDEPEAGIDIWSFKRMTSTFLELNKNTDTCIIIISHQERILALADEVIVIDKGLVKERTTNAKFIDSISDREDACPYCRKNFED